MASGRNGLYGRRRNEADPERDNDSADAAAVEADSGTEDEEDTTDDDSNEDEEDTEDDEPRPRRRL